MNLSFTFGQNPERTRLNMTVDGQTGATTTPYRRFSPAGTVVMRTKVPLLSHAYALVSIELQPYLVRQKRAA